MPARAWFSVALGLVLITVGALTLAVGRSTPAVLGAIWILWGLQMAGSALVKERRERRAAGSAQSSGSS